MKLSQVPGQGREAATGTSTTKLAIKADTPGQSGVPGALHGRSEWLELGKTQFCGCGSMAGVWGQEDGRKPCATHAT